MFEKVKFEVVHELFVQNKMYVSTSPIKKKAKEYY